MDKKSQLSSGDAPSSLPASDSSITHGRQRLLAFRAAQTVAASLEHTFAYFSEPRNLREITPPWLSLIVRRMDMERIQRECQIDYTIRWLQLPIPWTTRITEFEPPHRFVDMQLRGPYQHWCHEHRFEPLSDDRTLMTDVVEYAMPLGPLGSLAHTLAVRRQLEAILRYRGRAIERLFPGSAPLVLSRSRA